MKTLNKIETGLRQIINNWLNPQKDTEWEDLEEEMKEARLNYLDGYRDAKEGRKRKPHNTANGYCCACEYDIGGFEWEIRRIKRLKKK